MNKEINKAIMVRSRLRKKSLLREKLYLARKHTINKEITT